MLTPIILVLGLMAATAVIAYWSDNLGKKLGKKRVSLFGLRPKQTATLITITSSMPIMLFTLGALLAVHKPLRDALTKFEATRRENAILTQQNEFSRQSIERTQAREKLASQSAQEAEGRAAMAKLAARKAEMSLTQATKLAQEAKKREGEALAGAREARAGEREAKGRARQAQSSEQQARSGERRARDQERRANSAASTAQQKLQGARARLTSANARLASANTRLAGAESQLAARLSQLASKQAQLASTRTQLERATSQLNSQTKKQAKRILAQTAQILAQEARAAELSTQIEGLQAEVRQSRADVQLANAQLDSVRTSLVDVQTKPTLIPAGETLAEAIIAPRPSPSEFEAAMNSLLAEARAQVRRLGDSERKVMSIAFPESTEILADGSTLKIDEATQKSSLAAILGRADVPSSVRVVATRSHTTSESRIEVRLRGVEVRRAFGRGEMLASAKINGREGDARIFKQLLELANKGQGAAEGRGVQPPLSRDVPFYGPLTNERIFEALRAIQALKGLALVRIVATDDLLTSSPLSVRFDVAPAFSAGQST